MLIKINDYLAVESSLIESVHYTCDCFERFVALKLKNGTEFDISNANTRFFNKLIKQIKKQQETNTMDAKVRVRKLEVLD